MYQCDLNALTWSKPLFTFTGVHPLYHLREFTISRIYMEKDKGIIWGEIWGRWIPSNEELQKFGITPEMNWYEARHHLPCKEAVETAFNNIKPGSISTVIYTEGYMPGGMSSAPYKQGKSKSFERGMAKIERMLKSLFMSPQKTS